MARRIRFIPPNSLVEVTCRTIQGRLLLRPSPALGELIVGVLARAARLYPVEVHAFVFLSNHYHLLVSVPDANRLASFMRYLNSNLAREAGRLAQWRERFWGRRYQAIVVSDEVEAQIGRLRYILSHGSKEGLVRSPLDWPGPHCARPLLTGATVSGKWINRTADYIARRRGAPISIEDLTECERLDLTPIPFFRDLEPEVYRTEIRRLLEEIELDVARSMRAGNPPPLGEESVQRQHPHRSPRRVNRGPAPLAHAASGRIRREFRIAYLEFAAAFRSAALRLRSGDLLVEFPDGAFPPPRPFRRRLELA